MLVALMKRIFSFLTLLVLFSLLLTPTLVLARDGENEGQGKNRGKEISQADIKQRIEERNKERNERLASMAAKRKERLDEVKQKVCNQKESQIVRRSQRLEERAERQVKNFTLKADRVDTYYNNKLVPQGVTIASYSALKSNIEAQKTELKTAINSATEAAKKFDCQGEDPKGQLNVFHQEMRSVIAALKDFRTSIKDFIVAIRTAKASKTATSSAQ